jgi:hypothetical protein
VEFFAPSAHQLKRVYLTPAYLTGYVPPTGFLTLTTAYSSPERPALFHAGNAHGVSLFREFPSQPGPATHRHRITLLAFLLTRRTNYRCRVRRLVRANLSACGPSHSSPSGLCSGCESVPWEDCYIQNPAADSLVSFFASPGYYPDSAATLRATRALMRFTYSTALVPPSKLDEPKVEKQGALQRLNHQAWNLTLTSEISPPEVLRPAFTISPNNSGFANPVRFWPDSALLPGRTSPRSQGLLGQFSFCRFGK